MPRRTSKTLKQQSKIRIIAGQWRGRKLSVLTAPDLRPTPARVRETLFNWLQDKIIGACCLDLFAGTGILGFEAISRGARTATMVEADPKRVQLLKQHATILGSQQHQIVLADGLHWLQKKPLKGVDIIFLDPPFGRDYIQRCCTIIGEGEWLNEEGMIYIESERALALPSGWQIKKQMTAGRVKATLIEKL